VPKDVGSLTGGPISLPQVKARDAGTGHIFTHGNQPQQITIVTIMGMKAIFKYTPKDTGDPALPPCHDDPAGTGTDRGKSTAPARLMDIHGNEGVYLYKT
jgi:hypothetical protein